MSADDDVDRAAREAVGRLAPLYREVATVLVGQGQLVDRLLIGLLTGGHVLLEGLPGLAKTLTVRTLAAALRLTFRRIQFTPDLLPADVLGTQVFHPKTGDFTVRKGPVFANLILADEINRAPAKVQSALLEAMEERQVTLGEHTYQLDQPFLVLATQNPIEQEGTYPLPEAQLDRFMFKVVVDYPSREEERQILARMSSVKPVKGVEPVLGPEDVAALRAAVDGVHVEPVIADYALDLVRATRRPADYGIDLGRFIQYGASVRAGIFLLRAARAHALLDGRGFVTPHDVKSLAADVLRHRILLTYEAEADDVTTAMVLTRILGGVPVP